MIRVKLSLTAEISTIAELEEILSPAHGLFPKNFLRQLRIDQDARTRHTIGGPMRRHYDFSGSIRQIAKD